MVKSNQDQILYKIYIYRDVIMIKLYIDYSILYIQ